MQPRFPQRTLVPPELFEQFIVLAASSSIRFRLRMVLASDSLPNVDSVVGSLRPEKMDSHALTLSSDMFGIDVSFLVPAQGPLCRDAIVVG
jgi:hypothetical protein